MPGIPRENAGCLCPERLYTRDGVMNAIGIGRRRLIELERSGRLAPRENEQTKEHFYLGIDVIRAMVPDYDDRMKGTEK